MTIRSETLDPMSISSNLPWIAQSWTRLGRIWHSLAWSKYDWVGTARQPPCQRGAKQLGRVRPCRQNKGKSWKEVLLDLSFRRVSYRSGGHVLADGHQVWHFDSLRGVQRCKNSKRMEDSGDWRSGDEGVVVKGCREWRQEANNGE